MVENATVNNNASVVVVGRTAPVPPGQQPMAKSIPVVLASDQTPVPVVEQNKVLSEVSLSLLGIPRSETALGIFADVNTYDVNPSEWSAEPNTVTTLDLTPDSAGYQAWGLNHLPTESGALIQAPQDRVATLTSKRFFRYQPGRVSSATFGVKNKVLKPSTLSSQGYPVNGTIKKFGIYDKYDGYYWEVRHDGVGDNFAVVRRTQSLNTRNPIPYGTGTTQQKTDYGVLGTALGEPGDLVVLRDGLIHVHAAVYDPSLLKTAPRINFDSLSDVDPDPDTITVSDPDNLLFTGQAVLYVDNGNTASMGLVNNRAYFVEVIPGSPKKIKLYATWALSGAVALTATENNSTHSLQLLTDQIQFDADLIVGGNEDTVTLTASQFGKVSPWRVTESTTDADNTFVVYPFLSTADPSNIGLTQGTRYRLKVHDVSQQKVRVYNTANQVQQLTDPEGALTRSLWRAQMELSGLTSAANKISVTGNSRFNIRVNQPVVAISGTGLTAGQIYFVKNLQPYENATTTTFELMQQVGGSTVTISGNVALLFLIPEPHAFHVPLRIDATPYGTTEASTGMFPYLYKADNNTGAPIAGLIDTQLADTDTGASSLKIQMDAVNHKLLYNWVRDNVDPAYYSVYEYRVPRSRFSHEKLNGESLPVLYSDSVLTNRPGAPVRTGLDIVTAQSVWELDYTKVTMFKVDFSWYGAVGALFLAYVPVGNGEARWVRVHHLRASNQLKVASLGNAFLPITYQVYGGGSQRRWGYQNADRVSNGYTGLINNQAVNSTSEFLVKYGASYYIDGGDRGTTRLFSYSRPDFKDVYGQQSSLSFTYDGSAATNPLIYTATNISAYGSFFQNARVITDQGDQNVFVTYYSQDESNHRLHLNKPLTGTPPTNIRVIADRAAPVLGLKCKDFILSGEGVPVRNRTQIYPTKLNLGVGSVTGGVAVINLKKSPLFQTSTTLPAGSFSVTAANVIGTGANPIELTNVDPAAYLNTFGKVYGWFRCQPVVNNALVSTVIPISVLGLLERRTDGYYFTSVNILDGNLGIMPNMPFLLERNYDAKAAANLSNTWSTTSLTRLSAVLVDSEQRCPIPGTGQTVATMYVPVGGSEFDLTTYFDYNKDYLSFPLTNQVESLYVLASSAQPLGAPTVTASLTASLTWEEQ